MDCYNRNWSRKGCKFDWGAVLRKDRLEQEVAVGTQLAIHYRASACVVKLFWVPSLEPRPSLGEQLHQDLEDSS